MESGSESVPESLSRNVNEPLLNHDFTWRTTRGSWWLLRNIYIKPQSIPAPGKCLLRNDHRGPRLNMYDPRAT